MIFCILYFQTRTTTDAAGGKLSTFLLLIKHIFTKHQQYKYKFNAFSLVKITQKLLSFESKNFIQI